MSEFESWQVEPAVAAGLEKLGWAPDAPELRDVLPPAARGTNVVAVIPPVPAWAAPVAAGVLSGVRERGGRVLVLTAPALVAEWGATFAALAAGMDTRIEAARGPARAARRLKADALDVLIASPDTALNLLTRSSLATDRFTAIIFAWPEDWDADEAVAVLLQDLPKDAQRIVLTGRPDGAESLVERYARRALVFGVPSPDPEQPRLQDDGTPYESARTVAAPWASRAAAVADLIEATDPGSAIIWTIDTRDHHALRAALGGNAEGITIAVRPSGIGGTVICYDPPTLQALRGFAEGADVTIIVPPGTEAHLARTVARRRPVQLTTTSTSLLARDAGLRSEIVSRLSRGDHDAALYALAPLFERHEPQLVAAGLFELWREASARTAAVAAPVLHTTPVGGVTTTRLWVGAGKKDEATVGDLVAVLVKEVGVDRTLIGRIELRDTFSLVEVPAAEAERIARGLTGLTVRRRKLTAHVDRGPGAPRGEGGFGGSRGGGGGPSRGGGFGAPRGERR